jgi:hypothetical protein
MEGRTAGLWLAAGRGAGADADAAAVSSPSFVRISAKASLVTSCTITNQCVVSIHE